MSQVEAKRVELNSEYIEWIKGRLKGSNVTSIKLTNVPVIEKGIKSVISEEQSKLGLFIKDLISIYESEYSLKVSIEHDLKELKDKVKTTDSRVLKAVYDKYEGYELDVLKQGYAEGIVDVASRLGVVNAKYYPEVIKEMEQGVGIESRNYVIGNGREYLFEGIPVVYEKGLAKGVKEFDEMVVKRLKGRINRGNTEKFLTKIEDKQGSRIKVPEDFSKFPGEVSRELNRGYNEYKLWLYMSTKGKILRGQIERVCILKVEKGEEESVVIRKRPKLTVTGAEVRVIKSGSVKGLDVQEPLWCGEEYTKRIKSSYREEAEVSYKEVLKKVGGVHTLGVDSSSYVNIKRPIENGISLEQEIIASPKGKVKIVNKGVLYYEGKEVKGLKEKYEHEIIETIQESLQYGDEEEVLKAEGEGLYEVDLLGNGGIWRYANRYNLEVSYKAGELGLESEISKLGIEERVSKVDKYEYKGVTIARARIHEYVSKGGLSKESAKTFGEDKEIAKKMKDYIISQKGVKEMNYDYIRGQVTGDGISKGEQVSKRNEDRKKARGIGYIEIYEEMYGKQYHLTNVPVLYKNGSTEESKDRFQKVFYEIAELSNYKYEEGTELDVGKLYDELRGEDKESYGRRYGSYVVGLYIEAEDELIGASGLGVKKSVETEDYRDAMTGYQIRDARVVKYGYGNNSYTSSKRPLECGSVYYHGILHLLSMKGKKVIDYKEGIKQVEALLNTVLAKNVEMRASTVIEDGVKLKGIPRRHFELDKGEYEEDGVNPYGKGSYRDDVKLVVSYLRAKGKKELDYEKEYGDVLREIKGKFKDYGVEL